MKKYLFRPLAVVLLLSLLLAGCAEKSPNETTVGTQQTSGTVPSGPNATEPSVPEPPVTEPSVTVTKPTDPPPSVEPVKTLKCARWKNYPEFVSLGSGAVLASRNYYDSKKGGIVNSMEIIDVYADEVLAAIQNDSTREPVLQRFNDDAIVVADPKTNQFFVYDVDLKLLSSFSAPRVDGFFSHDRKNYYFVDSNVLYRMDVASGNRGRMALDNDLRLDSLVSIHESQDLLVAKVYLSFYTDSVGIAVIDGKTGKLRLLTDDLAHVWLTDDTFYGVQMHETFPGYDVYYGSLSGGEVKKISAETIGTDQYSYSVLAGSNYLLRRLAPDEGERNTTIYDLANGGKSADLKKYGFKHAAAASIFLKDEQLILGLTPDGAYFEMVRIDPKVLKYEGGLDAKTVKWPERVDPTVSEAYRAEVKGPALPEALSQLRTQADSLEKKYNVKIRIGTQTKDACDYVGYTVAVSSDAAKLKAALDVLDQALAKYPEGLLKQLRNGAGEGGLYLNLTGTIENKLSTVGFVRLFRDRYEIGLDITAADLEKTIHHEIWHALEMRISTDNFYTKKWNNCNPSGFSYYGRYDTGYESLTKWTYTGGSGAGSYFVDPYSRINGREDRARIFEMVMATDAAELMKASALKDKLEIMSSVLRQHFEDDGWSNVRWEQFL